MINVTILAMNTASATTITALMDVFSFSGVVWNMLHGNEPHRLFECKIVTPDGGPAQCMNNITVQSHGSMAEVDKTDLIFITSLANIEETLAHGQKIMAWLQEQHDKGTHLAAVCTGSFVLAATGLLDGKIATTHWGFVDVFRQLFPKVDLQPDRLLTDAGTLYCSGAFISCIDLALYLVEKLQGRQAAVECAKSLVYDIGRNSQTPYAAFRFQRNHNDGDILLVQQFMEKKFFADLDSEQLAYRAGMGRRTLERRFRAATGDTPLRYLQRVRVEQAKQILENSNLTFEEISNQVGYEDSSFFRKIFKKHTGLLPNDYRSKFNRPYDVGIS